MKNASDAPDAYFKDLPDDRREQLERLRRSIKRTWPGIKEDMAYAMPTYHLDGHTLYALANQKRFMVLYVLPYDLLIPFKNDLRLLDCGRSCIRFKRFDGALPDLLEQIIKFTGSKFTDSRYHEHLAMRAEHRSVSSVLRRTARGVARGAGAA